MVRSVLVAGSALRVGRWKIPIFRATLSFLAALTWFALAATCNLAIGQTPCPGSADRYQGYTVKNVRIETPLSVNTPLAFLFGSQKKLQNEFHMALARLPLKKEDVFIRGGNHSSSIGFLSSLYDEKLVSPGERIRLAFTTYRLEACDDTARTVEVVYLIYSSEFLYYASRIFEKQPDRLTRALAPGNILLPGSLANTTNKLLPQPFVGYDSVRKLYGGARTSLRWQNGFLDKFDLALGGSTNSVLADLNLAGSTDRDTGPLSHLEWRLGYGYSRSPSDPIDLKASTAIAQLFGASQPLGGSGIIFRFGASLEHGNRQTDLQGIPGIPQTVAQSGHGAVKLYAGATLNHGRRAWTGSYGLQLGNDGGGIGIDYAKHVVDASYRARFLLRDHKPLRFEMQFSAGAIRTFNGSVPIVERFFGGNTQRHFIEGDEWVINSSPLIRSFPQNGFNRIGSNAPIGGEHFVSTNFTLSYPVWNYPAVPAEITTEPEVRDMIGGTLRSARQATLETYLAEEKPYQILAAALLNDLTDLEEAIKNLPRMLLEMSTRSEPIPASVIEVIHGINDDDFVTDAMARINVAKCDKLQIKPVTKDLILGFKKKNKDKPGLIPSIIKSLSTLADAFEAENLTDDSEDLRVIVQNLESIQDRMEPRVQELQAFGAVKVDDYRAMQALLNDSSQPDDMARIVKGIEGSIERIKIRANDLPRIGRDSALEASDITGITTLSAKLRDGKDPLSLYLFTQLTPSTQGILKDNTSKKDKTPKPLPDNFAETLAVELNRVLGGPSIYNDERFFQVQLTTETEELTAQNLSGKALFRLNRLLLAEAYPKEITKSKLDELIQPLEAYVSEAKGSMGEALKQLAADPKKAKGDVVRSAIHQLLIGFGKLAHPLVIRIAEEIRKLKPVITDNDLMPEADQLEAGAVKLLSVQKQARRLFASIVPPKAERMTDRDIDYSANALDVLFRELNLVEVSPFVVLDVARIGPQLTPNFGTTRYGLGPGVRFSIVTLDFSAGYSFNLNRRPDERHGAFIFSMNISDLFR